MGATFSQAPTLEAPPVKRGPMTLLEQATFLREMLPSMKMSDGAPAKFVVMELWPEQVDQLLALADRLERMSAHETAIRRLVTGR